MIQIDDIISIHTNTESEKLFFAADYLVNNSFTFDLTVHSENFQGTARFCIRRAQIEKLCADLSTMYSNLTGSAQLDDNDSDGFLKLNIEKDGHLVVIGQVGGTNEDHYLKFKFQTDQTTIPQFVQDFKMLLLNQDS